MSTPLDSHPDSSCDAMCTQPCLDEVMIRGGGGSALPTGFSKCLRAETRWLLQIRRSLLSLVFDLTCSSVIIPFDRMTTTGSMSSILSYPKKNPTGMRPFTSTSKTGPHLRSGMFQRQTRFRADSKANQLESLSIVIARTGNG